MEKPGTIIVAIDFSEYALTTLKGALELARAADAKLIVVNVINARDIAGVKTALAFSGGMDVDVYVRSQKEDRRRQIAELLNQVGVGDFDVKTVVRVGVPSEEILEAISELRADLVVLGTKGRSNLAHTLFGSVAETVFRRSPVSVLSVRGPAHAQLVSKLV